MDHVDVDGLRIAFVLTGTGPPLVLLHGFVADGTATWRGQLEGLSDEFTVIAWDAPGAGQSSDPPPAFGIDDYAECLAGFVKSLDLGRVHLVALSFGGIVALQLLRRHRQIATTLVLAGAYAGWTGSLGQAGAEERMRLSERVAGLPPGEFVAAMLPSMFSASAPPDVVETFAASVAEFRRDGFLAMARASAEADLTDMLGDIDLPTLLLFGDADVRAPLEVGERLHAAIPDSRLVVMSGVGHVSSVQAAELFNREVRHFLREHMHR
jgi:pimeloyl-ACP methyl ester carboxylesterase